MEFDETLNQIESFIRSVRAMQQELKDTKNSAGVTMFNFVVLKYGISLDFLREFGLVYFLLKECQSPEKLSFSTRGEVFLLEGNGGYKEIETKEELISVLEQIKKEHEGK